MDTIVALASPSGVGAINVLRLSGGRAFECARKILHQENEIDSFEPRRVYLRKLRDENLLDRALIIFFPGPNSYTGEDVVEIHCHGGEVISNRIISALIRHGCRLAVAGEFTRRAVENGKMDLLQAEAVHDLILAESPAAADNALRQLDGELSTKIRLLREQLIKIAALLELELDFAEEDIRFAEHREIDDKLKQVSAAVQQLLSTYEKGRGLRRGLRVAIIGKPNVGKSSLLNAIVGSERAIVSSQPGTTRDYIEEVVEIGKIRFRFIDTAGIRKSDEEIEQEGIARTKRRIQDADILLFVLDVASTFDEHDHEISRECEMACAADISKKIILVKNKIDLEKKLNGEVVPKAEEIVSISALSKQGVDELLRTISTIAQKYFSAIQDEVFITNLRQKNALDKALGFIQFAMQSSGNKLSGEFIARDLRAAADELAGLLGEITSEHILDEIFANFCIGK